MLIILPNVYTTSNIRESLYYHHSASLLIWRKMASHCVLYAISAKLLSGSKSESQSYHLFGAWSQHAGLPRIKRHTPQMGPEGHSPALWGGGQGSCEEE